MPAGRPSSYKPEYAEQAGKLCAMGATDAEIAGFFNVNVATIYRWKLVHQEFCDAIKSGKDPADDRVERSLFQRATGYDFVEQQAIKVKAGKDESGALIEDVKIVDVERHVPADTTAAIFWLKNRRKDDWRDKQHHAHGGDPDAPPIETQDTGSAKLANFLNTVAERIGTDSDPTA